jgi:hypothetical protein
MSSGKQSLQAEHSRILFGRKQLNVLYFPQLGWFPFSPFNPIANLRTVNRKYIAQEKHFRKLLEAVILTAFPAIINTSNKQ